MNSLIEMTLQHCSTTSSVANIWQQPEGLPDCTGSYFHTSKSRTVAELTITSICHISPVRDAGGDLNPGGLAEKELAVQRWSILWRSLILSTFDRTIYPYHKHLQELNLRELGDLLVGAQNSNINLTFTLLTPTEPQFRDRIAKNFFSGELSQFHFIEQTPTAKRRIVRYDYKKIIIAIGNVMTQHIPRLESLTGPTMSDALTDALPQWASRLTHLKSLTLWDGKALANETTRHLLHTQCPSLSSLTIFLSNDSDADDALAAFIAGMKANSLTNFENLANCRIGPKTCSALNKHGLSLKSLKLALAEDGVLAMALLQDCTSITTLEITNLSAAIDLKGSQNDVYMEIIKWLQNCTALTEIRLEKLTSAPDLLLPVLRSQDISLRKLQVISSPLNDDHSYIVKDHLDFHAALSQQSSLRSLLLHGDPEGINRDGIETIMNAICSLSELRDLKFTRISDYFTDEHISLLAKHLTGLEDLTVGGYGITDKIWQTLSEMKSLKAANFSGLTYFTMNGLKEFIDQLDEGNAGFQLSIEYADFDSALSEKEQDQLRDLIVQNVNGRFDYQIGRGKCAHSM